VATKTLRFLDPSVDSDADPVWSPDGRRIAFLRNPAGAEGLPFTPQRAGQPWSIRVAEVASGAGRQVVIADPGPGRLARVVVAEPSDGADPRGRPRVDARDDRRRWRGRVQPSRPPHAASAGHPARPGRGHAARPRAGCDSVRLPGGCARRPAARALPRRGWDDDPWSAVRAARHQDRGPAARRDLLPRRLATSDAPGMALLLLLSQRVRAEPVPREPRLRRPVRQLPQRDRVRDGIP